VVPRKNITALAAGITVYNSVSAASSAVAGAIASRTNAGNVIGVIVVNSSVNDSLISMVQYKFNVSKALLSIQGIAPGSVHLYRQNLTAAKWVALPTNLTGSNSTQYFFTATSPGMSVYMIGFGYLETNITAVNTTNVQSAKTPQNTKIDPLLLVAGLLLLVAIVVVYFALFRTGRSEPPQEPSVDAADISPTSDEALDAYIKEGKP